MNQQVGQFDREPANKWHPEYESIRDWLDAEAPADQGQKLRNRPKWRRKVSGLIECTGCGAAISSDEIVRHLKDAHTAPRVVP